MAITMTCRELVDFLIDYTSGQLPADQRARFEEHLRDCPDCIAYLKSYEDTVKLGKDAFTHPDNGVPDEVPETLIRAILAARRQRP
jgi:anti-sigma factor RsiW